MFRLCEPSLSALVMLHVAETFSSPHIGQAQVKILLDDIREPGKYTLHFNASGLSSGIYFYKLDAGRFTETHKMVLLK